MSYDEGNIFAKILRGEAPAYSLYENQHCIAILDVMPQANGHTLVLPKSAATDLFDLDPDMARELMVGVQHVAHGVRKAFAPEGIKLMQFNGPVAGQTVFHLHVHIVPCYANQPVVKHAQDFADAATLEQHAEMIRAALD
jgi:histidine triad (HIT) family protein